MRPKTHYVFDVFVKNADYELTVDEVVKELKKKKINISNKYLYVILDRLQNYGVISSCLARTEEEPYEEVRFYGIGLSNEFLRQYFKEKPN